MRRRNGSSPTQQGGGGLEGISQGRQIVRYMRSKLLCVAFLFLVFFVVRFWADIQIWLGEVQEWERDMRRGPHHAHTRPAFDEFGNPRRNPFAKLMGPNVNDDEAITYLVVCLVALLPTAVCMSALCAMV